jgi:hypothetical protein
MLLVRSISASFRASFRVQTNLLLLLQTFLCGTCITMHGVRVRLTTVDGPLTGDLRSFSDPHICSRG